MNQDILNLVNKDRSPKADEQPNEEEELRTDDQLVIIVPPNFDEFIELFY